MFGRPADVFNKIIDLLNEKIMLDTQAVMLNRDKLRHSIKIIANYVYANLGMDVDVDVILSQANLSKATGKQIFIIPDPYLLKDKLKIKTYDDARNAISMFAATFNNTKLTPSFYSACITALQQTEAELNKAHSPLQKIPDEILDIIVDNAGLLSQAVLAKTSRDLRMFVDDDRIWAKNIAKDCPDIQNIEQLREKLGIKTNKEFYRALSGKCYVLVRTQIPGLGYPSRICEYLQANVKRHFEEILDDSRIRSVYVCNDNSEISEMIQGMPNTSRMISPFVIIIGVNLSKDSLLQLIKQNKTEFAMQRIGECGLANLTYSNNPDDIKLFKVDYKDRVFSVEDNANATLKL